MRSSDLLGVLIERKQPKDVGIEVKNGLYDAEIQAENTTPDTEKQKELDKYIKEIKAQQDKAKKAEEEAKAAEVEGAEGGEAVEGAEGGAAAEGGEGGEQPAAEAKAE